MQRATELHSLATLALIEQYAPMILNLLPSIYLSYAMRRADTSLAPRASRAVRWTTSTRTPRERFTRT